jgi:glycosyltransferase involved in cell wall biosynthesis
VKLGTPPDETSLPLVSVIVPVFNEESHLTECVESILAQTYQCWQLLISDNCSTDGTGEVGLRFSELDPRIRYERHDEFVDVVASHNRALESLPPEAAYCKFVGADDWLFQECLSAMAGVGEAHPEVGVIGAYRLRGTVVDLVGFPYTQETESGKEVIARSLRGELSVIGSSTSLLFRSNLVRERGRFFDPGFRHSDTDAALWSLMRSDFGIVHQVLTFTREVDDRQSSVSEDLDSIRVERIRWLVKYGSLTMPAEVYRRELRRQLRGYVRMVSLVTARETARRVVARSHTWAKPYRDFQRKSIDRLISESGNDREVRTILSPARSLLR